MEEKKQLQVPEINTTLRQDTIQLPEVIRSCSGIKIFGKKIKSIVYSTDIAIIRNINADAVIAVYPFTPHPTITKCITEAADIPVFSGVGGGLTQGKRSVHMSMFAESQGAIGVVVNSPTPMSTIKEIHDVIAIPIVGTVTSIYADIEAKLEAGVAILNVSGGKHTAQIVQDIRQSFPEVPIIATGGPTEASIQATIEAGANAITYTPPTNGALFSQKMDKYRVLEKENYEKIHHSTK